MSRNTDFFFWFDKAEGSLVISNRSRLVLLWWFLSFGRFSNTSNGSYNKVCRQFVFSFKLMITKVLEFDLIGGFMFFRNRQNVITAISKSFKGFLQDCGYFFINFKSTFNCFN